MSSAALPESSDPWKVHVPLLKCARISCGAEVVRARGVEKFTLAMGFSQNGQSQCPSGVATP